MKLKRFLAVFCLAIGTTVLFIACEKQDLPEAEGVALDNLIPVQDLEDGLSLNDGPLTEFPLEMEASENVDPEHQLIQEEVDPNDLVQLRVRQITKARTRKSSSSASSSSFGCSKDYFIECGREYVGTTDEDYEGLRVTETYDDQHYGRFGLKTDLEGYEKVYYLNVEREKSVTFKLYSYHHDVAMILLKGVDGELSCDINGDREDAVERAEKLVAYTTARARRTKYLGPVRLKPGVYFLVLDSKRGRGSKFKLELDCRNNYETCGSRGIFYDKFVAYQQGDISNQSVYYEKWNAEAYYDGRVVETNSSGYGPAMLIQRQRTYTAHQPNVLLCLGERKFGTYSLEMELGVHRGYSAYFSEQKVLSEKNRSNERGVEFYFKSDGQGIIKGRNFTKYFSYRNGYWQKLKLYYDFHRGRVKFYIGGHLIHEWSMSGSKQIEAIQFYPYYSNSKYFVDRVCLSN